MLSLGNLAGKKYLVLGLGRSGRAAFRSLEASGAEVHAWDDDCHARELAAADGLSLSDPKLPDTLADLKAVVVSPGVPHLYPEPSETVALALDAGIPLNNDIGLFFSAIRNDGILSTGAAGQIIAVTGSNGKSTTTALINHVLNASGRESRAAGNIGKAVLELSGIEGFVVLEISSYQAELAQCLDPDIAVFLNFSPDHVERHGGQGGYFAAKTNLFGGNSLRSGVIGVDEPEGRFLAARVEGRIGQPGTSRISVVDASRAVRAGVSCRNGVLVEYRDGREISSIDLSGCTNLKGTHNQQNACAAYSACRSVGLASDEIAAAMTSFPGLAHRMQIVGNFRGIQCVNDSKATNAKSAEMALRSFRRIRWIAGGLGKEGGLSTLAEGLENVEKVYLIGRSAVEFAAWLEPLNHEICGDMANAVKKAFSDALPGDTILLSPAAASFDQYQDFERRGEHFVREIQHLTG